MQGREHIEKRVWCAWGPVPENHGVVEVWKYNVVPAETRSGASFEGWDVICKVGDDHLHNLGRKPVPLPRVFGGIRVPACECARQFCFGTIPDGIRDALDSYDSKLNTKHRAENIERVRWIPDNEDVVLLGNPVLWLTPAIGGRSQGCDLDRGMLTGGDGSLIVSAL